MPPSVLLTSYSKRCPIIRTERGCTVKRNAILGNTWYLDGKGADLPYYHVDEKTVILLDGGCPGADEQAIRRLLEDAGLRVAAVFCTHAHPDHMALCGYYQSRGAKLIMPSFEAACVASAENLKAWYPLFTVGQVRKLFSFMLLRADVRLEPEQKEAVICGVPFGIVSVPGHTPGQIALRTPDQVLYLSDALMSRLECGRAKLPYAFSIMTDFETRERLRHETAERYVLAHFGVEHEIGELLGLNAQLYLDVAEEVLGLLDDPMTLEQLLIAVIRLLGFRSASTEYGLRLIEQNLRSFVDYLIDADLARQFADGGRMLYQRT